MRRFRWTDGPHDFIGALPRDGANLRSPIADDAVTRRRGRDQAQPALLCTIRQDGSSGEWSAEDGDGNPCTVENGANGLEVYAAPQAEGDQADPEIIGTAPAGAANLDALRRRIGPRAVHDRTLSSQEQAGERAAYQQYLDEVYRPRS